LRGLQAEDLDEILRLSDHVIFNSPGQIIRCSAIIEAAARAAKAFDIGLRINPLASRRAKCRAMIRARRIRGWAFRSTS
jgi:hypothetical protein